MSQDLVRARYTKTIGRLEAEWTEIAGSSWLCRQLDLWAEKDDRLAFKDGHQLLAAAQERTPGRWAERDAVLSALLDIYPSDETARRVALQVVLPGVKHLIDSLGCWEPEERAARLLAITIDVLAQCAADPARTPPNFRVFANSRRKAIRAAIRDRANPELLVEDVATVGDWRVADPNAASPTDSIDELIAWLIEAGQVREEVARLVVLTRTAGVAVDEIAEASGLSAQTLRRQRLRAEQRLRRGLAMAL